jgi:sensor histidine kinase YesM
MIPYVLGMNLIFFGTCILNSFSSFLLSFLYSAVYLFAVYYVFGLVAITIRNQFPSASDLFKRIRIMLPVFYVMNIAAVKGMALIYLQAKLISCTVGENMDWWGVLYGCVMSTVITFLNEGMANFEAWKSSLHETERLKNIHQRSKLLGLKGQINPHFLFNCFNTLSQLIQEDEQKAETFLDEMTRVHRYLLRSDDDLLVPLEDELKFATSYLYLIKERFNSGVEIHINVPGEIQDYCLPPLSMQVVLENIIYSNAIRKDDPLKITIEATSGALNITHTLHEKKIVEALVGNEGLDNLVDKYTLLKAGIIEISGDDYTRTIKLPFINKQRQ